MGRAPGFLVSHRLPGESGAAGSQPGRGVEDTAVWQQRWKRRSEESWKVLWASLLGRWHHMTDCLIFRFRGLDWGSDICSSETLPRGLWRHSRVRELARVVQLPSGGSNCCLGVSAQRRGRDKGSPAFRGRSQGHPTGGDTCALTMHQFPWAAVGRFRDPIYITGTYHGSLEAGSPRSRCWRHHPPSQRL